MSSACDDCVVDSNSQQHRAVASSTPKHPHHHHHHSPHSGFYSQLATVFYTNDPAMLNQKIRIKRPKSTALGPFYQQSNSSLNLAQSSPPLSSGTTCVVSSVSSGASSATNSFFKQISHKQDKTSYFAGKKELGIDAQSSLKSNRSVSTSSSSTNLATNLNATFKTFKLSSSWQKSSLKKHANAASSGRYHLDKEPTNSGQGVSLLLGNSNLYKSDSQSFFFDRHKR